THQLRVELREHTFAALKHARLRASAGGNVRKLGCDIAASNHDDTLGKFFKLHERIAANGMLRARKTKCCRARATGNENVATFEHMLTDHDTVRTNKARYAVKGSDTLLLETAFAFLWNRIGKTSFECDQLFPVDAHVAVDTASVHALCEVDHFLTAYQHLLRVASAQCAGAPEGAMVDDCH